MDTTSGRLRWCRRRFGWTQRDLARASGVGLATVRRVEQEQFAPRLATVQRLAATLRVREGWLAFGDGPMVAAQDTAAEGEPGVVPGGGGPWYRDEAGEWRVNARVARGKGSQA